MKYLTVVTLLFVANLSSCQSVNNLKTVEDFFEILVKSDSTDIQGLLELMTIKDSLLEVNNGEIIEMIKFTSYALNQWLKQCDMKYSVHHHNQIDKLLFNEYKLKYDNFDNVYYVVCNNSILTSVIIEDEKIISFFPYLIKNASKTATPVILN